MTSRARSTTGTETASRKWFVLTKEHLVELEGKTGHERRRLPIPAQASDCLVFANLSGGQRSTDFLVKTRYSQIWAFDSDGQPLWTVREPDGYRTAHQPRPIDLDADGRHEVDRRLLGPQRRRNTAIDIPSQAVDQARGHLDTCRLFCLGIKAPRYTPRVDLLRGEQHRDGGWHRSPSLGGRGASFRVDSDGRDRA